MAIQAADKRSASSDLLKGKRILVTRPRTQAKPLVQAIEALGGEGIEFPTIEIRPPDSYGPLDRAMEQIKTYDWLIFTSVNGVECFLARFKKLAKNLADLDGIEIVAIGPETAGWKPLEFHPASYPSFIKQRGFLKRWLGKRCKEKKC